MGCGCPTIVSTGGSLPEIAGNAAAVVACEDVQGMAREILRLLQDRDYRNVRSMRGIERAAQFSYHQAARETLQLYREVAQVKSSDSDVVRQSANFGRGM
jgi:glycosyltransferase involved in cell wall biosynthesis